MRMRTRKGIMFFVPIIIIVILAWTLLFVAVAKKSERNLGARRHTKYTLYIGTSYGNNGESFSYDEAKKILYAINKKYVDGGTLYYAEGFWREDDEKELITEKTLVCVYIDVPHEAVKNIMDDALKELKQQSILLEVSEIRNKFYTGE